MTLTNSGFVYYQLRATKRSTNAQHSVWRSIGDRHLEAITHSINGRAYYAIGEPHKHLSLTMRYSGNACRRNQTGGNHVPTDRQCLQIIRRAAEGLIITRRRFPCCERG